MDFLRTIIQRQGSQFIIKDIKLKKFNKKWSKRFSKNNDYVKANYYLK